VLFFKITKGKERKILRFYKKNKPHVVHNDKKPIEVQPQLITRWHMYFFFEVTKKLFDIIS